MVKAICIGLLTIFSFVVSLYFTTTNITVDETSYGTSEVVFFIIPFTMLLVNSNILILPYLIKKNGSYSRFKDGIESIFLSLSLILFILHCGILLVTTGTDINLFLLIPISVGIVLMTTANTLPRFVLELNENTSLISKSSNHVWNVIIRPFSLPMFVGGIAMMFCIFLPGNFLFVGFFTILFCTLIVSIYFSYREYRSRF